MRTKEFGEECELCGGVARRRRFASTASCNAFLERRWQSAVTRGNALFMVVHRPEMVEERVPGIPLTSFVLKGEFYYETWFVEKCDFARSLEIAVSGRFSDWAGSVEPVQEILTFCNRVNERTQLGIFQVDTAFLLFQLVDTTAGLETEIADEAADINSEIFQVREPKKDRLDRIANWIDKGFFTIGRI